MLKAATSYTGSDIAFTKVCRLGTRQVVTKLFSNDEIEDNRKAYTGKFEIDRFLPSLQTPRCVWVIPSPRSKRLSLYGFVMRGTFSSFSITIANIFIPDNV
jgi:hypothetical protein